MATTYKRPTEYSATRTLQRFFAKYPDSDALTVEQILMSSDRNTPEFANKNEGWLSNKLTGIYYHNLAKATYSYHPYRKLETLELTVKGKRALGRIEDNTTSAQYGTEKTPAMPYVDLVKAIAAFKRDNPEFDVKFEVILKDELPMQQ